MKYTQNHLLSLLIVAALTSIGASATETFAVNIPVRTKAKLIHSSLPAPIIVTGLANVDVTGTTVNLGTCHMAGPLGAKVLVDFAPTKVNKKGRFIARGRARAKFVDPATGSIVNLSFSVVSKGRTDSIAKAAGRFRDVAGSPGAHLRGKYRH